MSFGGPHRRTISNMTDQSQKSSAAASAIKALQEKNFRLESDLSVMENLLKQYKQEAALMQETIRQQSKQSSLKQQLQKETSKYE